MPNKIDLQTTVQRKKEIAFTNIDKEIMLLHPEMGRYFSFNKIGSVIWNSLHEPVKVETLINQLTKKYDIDFDKCHSDVTRFLELLLEKKLIEII